MRSWTQRSGEGDEEMRARMKLRKKLNETENGNKQSGVCDKQGGDRGHVHNLKTPLQSFPAQHF